MSNGILVIEDEVILAKNIKRYLERHDYEVHHEASGEAGLKQIDIFKPDLILLDYQLPGIDGLEVLKQIREVDQNVRVILITGHGNVKIAVDAMKTGAYDYLSKPLILDELKLLIDRVVGQDRLEGALSYYRKRDAGTGGLSALLGESPPMQAMKNEIRRLLKSEESMVGQAAAAVLLTGETGTGKEVVARTIHFDGPRKDQPFVEINCAAIPIHLVESELFGYERGAFSGAKGRKIGLIEAADGGTLFLDEIGSMELGIQVKLLKLLEDKKVRRLGSLRDQNVNVRILAATNQSLEDLVEKDLFRSDLYYRLGIIRMEIPPLRDRGRDILLLANHFLTALARRYGKRGLHFTPDADERLLAHSWPGNVRELRNIVEQTVLLTSGDAIGPEQLFPLSSPDIQSEKNVKDRETAENGEIEEQEGIHFTLPSGGVSLEEVLEEVERKLVVQALKKTSGNVTQAAKMLQISRDTLRYRIEKYDLK